MPVVLPIIAAAGALYTIGSGIAQKAKANKIRKQNIRPTFNIQDEYYKNVSQAQSMAQEGMPQASQQYYTTQAERGLQSANDVALQTGQGVNSIAANLDVYNQGIGKIASQDALLRNDNIRYLIDQQTKLAEEKQKEFAINQYAPFQEKAREAAAMTNAGSQNISTGINQGVSAAAAYFNARMNEDLDGNSSPVTRITNPLPNATIVNNATTGAFNNNSYNSANDAIASNPVLQGKYYELITSGLSHQDAVNQILSGMNNSYSNVG